MGEDGLHRAHLQDTPSSASLRTRKMLLIDAELRRRVAAADDFVPWLTRQTMRTLEGELGAARNIALDETEPAFLREAMQRRVDQIEAEIARRSFTIADLQAQWQTELEQHVLEAAPLTMSAVSTMIDVSLSGTPYEAQDLEWKDGVITASIVRREPTTITLQVPRAAMGVGGLARALSGLSSRTEVVARTPHGSYTFEVVDVTREAGPMQRTQRPRTVLHLREIESERRASIADDVIAGADEQ